MIPRQPPVYSMRKSIPGSLLRTTLKFAILLVVAALVNSVLGQTNVEADLLQTEHAHNLRPASGIVRMLLWSLAAALLVIGMILVALRYRVATNLYKVSSDAQWNEDSEQDAGERVDVEEVVGACAVLEEPVAEAQ